MMIEYAYEMPEKIAKLRRHFTKYEFDMFLLVRQ